MLLLAFDTATSRVTVALHDGERVVSFLDTDESLRHGEHLAPAIERVPDVRPLSRLIGATPTSDAIRLPESVPSSGNSLISTRLTAGPMPGTPWSRSSFARHTGLASISPASSRSTWPSCFESHAMWARRLVATRAPAEPRRSIGRWP